MYPRPSFTLKVYRFWHLSGNYPLRKAYDTTVRNRTDELVVVLQLLPSLSPLPCLGNARRVRPKSNTTGTDLCRVASTGVTSAALNSCLMLVEPSSLLPHSRPNPTARPTNRASAPSASRTITHRLSDRAQDALSWSSSNCARYLSMRPSRNRSLSGLSAYNRVVLSMNSRRSGDASDAASRCVGRVRDAISRDGFQRVRLPSRAARREQAPNEPFDAANDDFCGVRSFECESP
jgi:hypothetical protein